MTVNLENMVGAIESYARVEEGKSIVKDEDKNAYQVLVESVPEGASGESARSAWHSDWRIAEDQMMTRHFFHNENAKHSKGKRKGQWKYSLLPQPYQSAKSVIGSAIELGVFNAELGKTAQQNAVNKARAGEESNDAGNMNKFTSIIAKAFKIVEATDDLDKRSEMREHVASVFGLNSEI